MNIVLANPLGFLALLGLPAVVLIHFLQRQARVIPVSTLFLLAQTQRESVSGRRFDRLTNSVPLWLQLLAVLLLTWLLVEPRYLKPASVQQVAVVVDSSASLTVFKEEAMKQLTAKLPELKGSASQLQIFLFESDPEKPTLYSGDSPKDALAALDAWQPASGALDPTNALRLARSRVSREGIIIYLTDTKVEDLPFESKLLAVGEPKENCGFTGVAFSRDGDTIIWKAILRNYSDKPQKRTWQVEFSDGRRSEPKTVSLNKNGMTTISAAFPPDSPRLRVLLDEDAFPLDNELPLVKPAPKALTFWGNTSPKFSDFAAKFVASFPGLETTNDSATADLSLVSYDPLLPELPPGDSIVVVDETTQSKTYLSGGIVAEKHALMDGLNWQSLLVRDALQLELSESDEVLLWQGRRPLIALRNSAIFDPADDSAEDSPPAPPRKVRQLIFNFDPTLSNAFRLPATVVLLHRFCEDLRDRKITKEVLNTETNQTLTLATHSGPEAHPLRFSVLDTKGDEIEARTIPLASQKTLVAPGTPGFFQIEQGEEILLQSACSFADTREADLSNCESADEVTASAGQAIDQNTSEDHLWHLWVLILLAALLLAWHFTKDRVSEESGSSEVGARKSESGTP